MTIAGLSCLGLLLIGCSILYKGWKKGLVDVEPNPFSSDKRDIKTRTDDPYIFWGNMILATLMTLLSSAGVWTWLIAPLLD